MPLPIGAEESAAPPAGALRAWADCTRDLMLLADAEGRLGWCNPAFERLLARPIGSLLGQPLATLLPLTAAHQPRWQAACEQLARGEAFDEVEVELEAPGETAGGTSTWLRIASHRLAVSAADPDARWLCLMTDVSEARRLDRAAVKLGEMLSLGRSFGRLGAWERDLRTGAGRWDPQVFRLYGFDPAHGVPTLDQAVSRIHPEEQAQFRYGLLNALPGRYDRRYRLMHPDGSIRWLHSQWEVRAAPDGTPERAFGILLDDTAAYELAQALGSISAQLKLAIELGNIAIWRHDLQTNRIACNERAHRVVGLPEGTSSISLAEFRARVHPEDLVHQAAAAGLALVSEQPTDIEIRFKGTDGR
ncbi:MAG: PAS domain-containing protein, partial [Burkholderiales bacterium]